ncbi:hypothetical protein [Caldilinea sp.]|uniref:hypothetical protein n=1 Tax=Caldilinea sp. TaxID=2293560 RepID=UPI002D13F1AD|nr:hypothetical protein [Caldilinea sp.]
MKKQPFKFVQMIMILALLLGSVSQAAAAPSPDAPAAPAAQTSPDSPTTPHPNQLVQLHDPQARRQTEPLEVSAAPGQTAAGWITVLTDSFESFPLGWTVVNAAALDQNWGATTHMADVEYNPASLKSVWPGATGANAVDPAAGNYPNNMHSWMIRGPIDLSAWQSAEIDFALNYDIEEGDWLSFCVGSFPAAPGPADFDHEHCSYLSGQPTAGSSTI